MLLILVLLSTVMTGQAILRPTRVFLPDAPSTELLGPDVDAPPSTTVLLKALPASVVADELKIVTSPARIRKSDLKWLLPLAGATGIALATDTYTMRHVVSINPSFTKPNSTSSDILRDISIAAPVLLFAAGGLGKDSHAKEAGFLSGQAMLDAYGFDEGLKYAALRERPYIDDARGHFFAGDAVPDPSFISGHCIVAWSSAAVLAGEYSRPWQQVGIYTLASGVSLTRVLSQQHFPTDALLGSAAGWLIGHYVFKSHHKVSGNESSRSRN